MKVLYSMNLYQFMSVDLSKRNLLQDLEQVIKVNYNVTGLLVTYPVISEFILLKIVSIL